MLFVLVLVLYNILNIQITFYFVKFYLPQKVKRGIKHIFAVLLCSIAAATWGGGESESKRQKTRKNIVVKNLVFVQSLRFIYNSNG